MSTGHKAARGQPGGHDAQNWKIWRKVHGVSIGLDSRKYSAIWSVFEDGAGRGDGVSWCRRDAIQAFSACRGEQVRPSRAQPCPPAAP
jgi:hypothetical protein